jgi:hypothetical protein
VSPNDLRQGDFEGMVKPKGGFVNCTCNWGLFRDRNVTLREPVSLCTISTVNHALVKTIGLIL